MVNPEEVSDERKHSIETIREKSATFGKRKNTY